jgi:hypothetical protein
VSGLRALSFVAIAALACALTLGVATGPAAALSLKENPFAQQDEKLVASGVSELAEQGSSVAISSNGDTALVGAPADNGFKGAAWVYVRSGTAWTQQAKLEGKVASTLAHQGASVALSADGNTALIGAPEDTGKAEEYYGAAYVFTREGTTWSEQKKLVATTGATTKGAQGSSVSLSANGNTALVGAMDNEYPTAPGAAFVFARSGSTWTQQDGALIGVHRGGLVQEGTSVALSADGRTAVIGGPREEGPSATPEEGGAWVFTESGSGWKEQTQLPTGTGAGIQTGAGQSVAVSGDGSTVLVGGPGYDEALGTAWVYTLSGATWTQQGEKLLGEDATLKEAQQGHSVSLSENGNTALIGGYHDDISVGAAWAFVRSGSTWTEQEKLVGTGSVGGFPTQGSSVTLSADSLTALVGGAGDNGEVGATWVFARAPESGGEPGPPPAKPNEPEPNPNNQPTGNTSTAGSASSSGNSSSSGATNNKPPAPPTPTELETKLATAFGLPSAKLCYSRRSFKIHIQQPHGYPRVVSAEVFLGKKRERSLNKKGLTDQVVLTQLPYGTFTIRIIARTATGTTLMGTRTYHTCRPKPIHPHGHPRL